MLKTYGKMNLVLQKHIKKVKKPNKNLKIENKKIHVTRLKWRQRNARSGMI